MSDAYRDGEEGLRARLDDLAWQRDVLLDKRLEADLELARLQREISVLQKSLDFGASAERPRWLWVWLVAVPAAGVGLWVMACSLWFPMCGRSKPQNAKVGAETIRQAAELYRNMEDDPGCPILERLVATKKLDVKKTDDPWGRPYLVECTGEDVRVTSAGKDRKFFTPDDIRDDFKPSDMKRVADLD